MKHCITLAQPQFADIESTKKSFQAIRNERNFKVGDTVFFQEHNGTGLTGKEEARIITYILDDHKILRTGYVVLGIKEVEG